MSTSNKHFLFQREFLGTHVNYTELDFEFNEVKQEYLNPYINHCYKLFLSSQESQCVIEVQESIPESEYYYVSFNESVCQEFEGILSRINDLVDEAQLLCKVFGANGFYPVNSYKTGFHFHSFAFKHTPMEGLWTPFEDGYLPSVPSLFKTLRVLLNSKKFKPIHYTSLLSGVKVSASNVKHITNGEGCVVFCLKKPIINYDVLVPTTKDYYQYILTLHETNE